MAFFGKKKPKDNQKEDSFKDIPDFSTNLGADLKFPEFPSYESTDFSLGDIKEEINKQQVHNKPKTEEIIVPERKKMPLPQMGIRPMEMQMPSMGRAIEERNISTEKPLFVKIDDYKDAIYTLDKIKARLKEADRILEELATIRHEEEKHLEEWKHDLENIKNKLLDVDKQLFEV